MATLISSRRKTRHREEWSPAPAHCRAWGENRRNAFIDNPGPAEIHDSSGVRKIFRAEGSLAHQRFDDSAHASITGPRERLQSKAWSHCSEMTVSTMGCSPCSNYFTRFRNKTKTRDSAVLSSVEESLLDEIGSAGRGRKPSVEKIRNVLESANVTVRPVSEIPRSGHDRLVEQIDRKAAIVRQILYPTT